MAKKPSRRMVLKGAAGFTLALPFMRSVLSSREAVAAGPTGCKRFVAFGLGQGGIRQQYMYPEEAVLTQETNFVGRKAYSGKLPVAVANGRSQISHVLSASSAVLTPTLASKLNLLRGFDIPVYMGHHDGGHLGNYSARDHHDDAAVAPIATLDQALAQSASFYGNAGTIMEKSMVFGSSEMSWEQNENGVQAITPTNNSKVLFNKIFNPDNTGGGEPQRPLVVDKVYEDYRRLRDSNRRISTADKMRLEEHMARVDELDRKLNIAPPISCSGVSEPAGAGGGINGQSAPAALQLAHIQIFNDVIAAAFACDTSRIATFLSGDQNMSFTFSDYSQGDWHGDVAHGSTRDEALALVLADASQNFFEGVFLDLMTKLDAIDDGNGQSVLDNSLLQWSYESGPVIHSGCELSVVTAGSAGGFFNTGNYIDYRNRNNVGDRPGEDSNAGSHTGALLNHWLGTAAQAMGMPPAEFNVDGRPGYGRYAASKLSWYSAYNAHKAADIAAMNDILPFLKA